MPAQVYLVDAFGPYAASALAANTVLRSLFGTFLPFAGPQMYETLRPGWENTLLGLLGLAFAPVPWLFYSYGEQMRKRWVVRLWEQRTKSRKTDKRHRHEHARGQNRVWEILAYLVSLASNSLYRKLVRSHSGPVFSSSKTPRGSPISLSPKAVMHRIDSFQYRLCVIFLLSFWIYTDSTSKNVDEQSVLNPSFPNNCLTSYLTANEVVDQDVVISAYDTLSNTEFPKMTTLSTSAWELWYFDDPIRSHDSRLKEL